MAASAIYNIYAYPNADAYKAGKPFTSSLTHGFICSMKQEQQGGDGTTRSANHSYLKMFQFNPIALPFTLQMIQLDSADTAASGGNDATTGGVGQVSSGISLFFNREIETHRATMGMASAPSYFKDIGVQKDVLDIYRVILGDDAKTLISDRENTESMMGELFDSAVAGTMVANKPIIVSFNQALSYYGNVVGMSYEYQKFNYKLVPTAVTINLTIDILKMDTSKALMKNVSSGAAAGQAAFPDALNKVKNFINW